MKIDKLFEKYPENIIGFRVNKTTKIIDFWLNNDWELLKTTDQYNIKKQKDDENGNRAYYIIFTESMNFEQLFKHLSDIIDHNLDIEKKQKLFSQKMGELKKLFTSLSYDELKQIQFDTPFVLTEPTQIDPNDDNELTPDLIPELTTEADIRDSDEDNEEDAATMGDGNIIPVNLDKKKK
jgi:hypothetical protein